MQHLLEIRPPKRFDWRNHTYPISLSREITIFRVRKKSPTFKFGQVERKKEKEKSNWMFFTQNSWIQIIKSRPIYPKEHLVQIRVEEMIFLNF